MTVTDCSAAEWRPSSSKTGLVGCEREIWEMNVVGKRSSQSGKIFLRKKRALGGRVSEFPEAPRMAQANSRSFDFRSA